MIIYPDKPWSDGQTFKITLEDGTNVIGSYKESKNSWTMKRVVDDRDAKFASLRTAVDGATDFDTLKQRLLDVL